SVGGSVGAGLAGEPALGARLARRAYRRWLRPFDVGFTPHARTAGFGPVGPTSASYFGHRFPERFDKPAAALARCRRLTVGLARFAGGTVCPLAPLRTATTAATVGLAVRRWTGCRQLAGLHGGSDFAEHGVLLPLIGLAALCAALVACASCCKVGRAKRGPPYGCGLGTGAGL